MRLEVRRQHQADLEALEITELEGQALAVAGCQVFPGQRFAAAIALAFH